MKFPEPDAPEQPIGFLFDDIAFELPGEQGLRDWLLAAAADESKSVLEVNYIFCSDEHLRDINVQFLHHDYYTDIITFDYSEGGQLRGEVYVSVERVTENARTHGVSFPHELCRVLLHGVLHMAGYGDKTPEQKALMRQKEDFYLARLPEDMFDLKS